MISISDKKNCCGCTACLAACPVSCIAMTADEEGFDYPVIDESKCFQCGKCEKVCPVLNQVKNPQKPTVYACYNKDEQIRMQSSSGGIFWLLVEQTIAKQGVVFGAKFDENFDVIHGYAETLEEAAAFRGSKYVQSKMGNCFKQAKEFLDANREVLFSGTPCQIAGLKKYLGKEYANLLTADLICHGVPSPKVFTIYKQNLENQYNDKVTNFDFRNKENGWQNFYNVVVVGGGNMAHRIAHPFNENIYMKGFLHNIYLRLSCYACCAKNFHSGSDITLGDFWGVKNVHPQFQDDHGTSLVLVNSIKGHETFDVIGKNLIVEKSSLGYAIRYNHPLVQSVKIHPKRSFVFEHLEKTDFVNLIEGCIKSQQTLGKRLKKNMRRIVINRFTRYFLTFLGQNHYRCFFVIII